MFVAAVDKLLAKIDSELLKRVRSGGVSKKTPASDWLPDCVARTSKPVKVSASGQQHGTVYWKNGAREILKNLNPEKCLQQGIHTPPRPPSLSSGL